jgi:sugar transferase (PEP-CTERM/EpsH1 system associated)
MALSHPLQPPLVVHVIYRLAVGGLENGVVNLLNHMPPERYRHAIVCLTESTDFRDRLQRTDVPIIALHKQTGQDFGVYVRLWKVFRRLRPDIVHTRNLSGLEYLVPAFFAGVAARIHGEHGRDIYDLDGSSVKYNLWRRVMKRFVHRYIAVSADLADWLIHTVGAGVDQVTHIYNGVDVQRFHPRLASRPPLGPDGFAPDQTLVVGTIGRMEPVKDQLTLVRAFLHLLDAIPNARQRLRLVIIGDGSLRAEALALLQAARADQLAWLPGQRADIPALMRRLDVFVLPSLAEGISNTLLEAMASGLPVVATRVGGNPELVREGETGMLVPPADPVKMAEAISSYAFHHDQVVRHGQAGRRRAEGQFSLEAMVNGYLTTYDAVLSIQGRQESATLKRIDVPYQG